MIKLYQNGRVRMILSDQLVVEIENTYSFLKLIDGMEIPDALLRELNQFCQSYINAQLIIIGCQQWTIRNLKRSGAE